MKLWLHLTTELYISLMTLFHHKHSFANLHPVEIEVDGSLWAREKHILSTLSCLNSITVPIKELHVMVDHTAYIVRSLPFTRSAPRASRYGIAASTECYTTVMSFLADVGTAQLAFEVLYKQNTRSLDQLSYPPLSQHANMVELLASIPCYLTRFSTKRNGTFDFPNKLVVLEFWLVDEHVSEHIVSIISRLDTILIRTKILHIAFAHHEYCDYKLDDPNNDAPTNDDIVAAVLPRFTVDSQEHGYQTGAVHP
jgi:hypothetical protein